MSYSGANDARNARESLGKALEVLQQEADVPDDVLEITQNVAQSIGALFEAEHASTEPDGKTCVKSALGTLSQTLALLQDVKSEHDGVLTATENIADVISILFPLTNKPSARPEARDSGRPERSSPAPATTSSRPPTSVPPSDRPASSRPLSGAPISSPPSAPPRPGAIPTSMLPPPAPVPSGERRRIEANLGATTQSNFYVGFSAEIAHGGVFLATYEALAKDTSVSMLVTLPGGFEFECEGYVRFVRDPLDFASESEPGMGIQFEGLSDEGRELALRFVRQRPPMFYDV
jgi:uncharacterized protein (TIGR02266 family)